MRVTNNMVINTVSRNLALSQSRLLRLQTMASSGRRINRPSDDPIGITKDLGFRSSLSNISQFMKNINQAESWLTFSDQAVGNINELIINAKELAVQLSNDTYDPNARAGGAVQIRDIFSQLLAAANTKFEGNYIFSGTKTDVQPLKVSAFGVVYQGDYNKISLETESNSYLSINSIGSFLTDPVRTLGDGQDLQPLLQNNLWLDYLNNGNGINLGDGQFIIKTLNGEFNVDISAARNVEDILNTINAAGIPNFAASIHNGYAGFQFEDTSAHQITNDTPLSMLNQGLGVDPSGTIRFEVAAGPIVDVDISAAVTVEDAVNEINAQLAAGGINNVTASIHPDKNVLVITDSNAAPLNISITEGTPGSNTAKDLGIIGAMVGELEGQVLDPMHIAIEETGPDQETAKSLGLSGATNLNLLAGEDVNPKMAYFTLLSTLNNGTGLEPGSFRIVNGDESKVIDLSALANDPTATVMDVIKMINSSGIDVEARINDQQTGITLFSKVEGRSLMVVEAGVGRLAKDLGIFGSPDLLGNMLVLEKSLESDNTEEINLALATFDDALNRVLLERADLGARSNRAEVSSYRLLSFQYHTTDRLSEVEDADLAMVITQIASAEAAYQAALASAARMIQPSLLNFLS